MCPPSCMSCMFPSCISCVSPFMYSIYVPFMYVSLYACYICSPSSMSYVSLCMHVTSIPFHVCHVSPSCVSSSCMSCMSPSCMSCVSPFRHVTCVLFHVCHVSPFRYVICIPLHVCHVCPLAISSGLLSLCRFCFCFLSQGLSMTS